MRELDLHCRNIEGESYYSKQALYMNRKYNNLDIVFEQNDQNDKFIVNFWHRLEDDISQFPSECTLTDYSDCPYGNENQIMNLFYSENHRIYYKLTWTEDQQKSEFFF